MKNIQQQILNVANYMMQIKYVICKMHHFSFSTQPNKTRERTASQPAPLSIQMIEFNQPFR